MNAIVWQKKKINMRWTDTINFYSDISNERYYCYSNLNDILDVFSGWAWAVHCTVHKLAE